MYLDLGPETSYRITLRLIRGVGAKLAENYLLEGDIDYYSWLSTRDQKKESYKLVMNLKKTISKLHRYLNSLGSTKKLPRYVTLYKYALKCREAKVSLLHLTCFHLMTSAWYLLSSYEKILLKMLHKNLDSYSEIFKTIAKDLVAASIHHEAFLGNSNFLDQLANTKKTFAILLA